MSKLLKKGAMFGLDARIALAILAVVALSVGTLDEKVASKTKSEETDFKLDLFKSQFLKHWEKVRKEGYIFDDIKYSNVSSGDDINHRGYTFKRYNTLNNSSYYGKYIEYSRILYMGSSQSSVLSDFTHPDNSIIYSSLLNTTGLPSNNKFPSNTYIPVISSFVKGYPHANDVSQDIQSKIILALSDYSKEVGRAKFKIYDGNTSPFTFNSFDYLSPGLDGYNGPIGMYFIAEGNVSRYSAKNTLLHAVIFSHGKNKVLDSTLPTSLSDLRTFKASGDDKFRIFSTQDIYTKLLIESNRRLNEINERIVSVAENNYVDRISLCSTETIVSSSCDLNNDGSYNTLDESLLLDINPYPKEQYNINSQYLDNTIRFNMRNTYPMYTFLSYLGLPEYYAVDLFGNHVRYDSNVANKDHGPYTMEVWY